MIGYVARRLLQLLPVLLIGSVGIWAMIYAVPGGPAGLAGGRSSTGTELGIRHTF